MPIRFTPIASETAAALRAGGPDVHGAPAERAISDGTAPCRHCLGLVPKGQAYLILAHRPFAGVHPYAETGPIFLCADPCEPPGDGAARPAMLSSPDYAIRGYDAEERIVYGTGSVVPASRLCSHAESLLANPKVAFVHVRSARNTCFQVRIDRAEETGAD